MMLHPEILAFVVIQLEDMVALSIHPAVAGQRKTDDENRAVVSYKQEC